MGYYTDFEFEVSNLGTCSADEIINVLKNDERFAYIFRNIMAEESGYIYENLYGIKWYEHDRDMLWLSEMFPTATFNLNGRGEDREDEWQSVYHNGKSKSRYIIQRWSDWEEKFNYGYEKQNQYFI